MSRRTMKNCGTSGKTSLCRKAAGKGGLSGFRVGAEVLGLLVTLGLCPGIAVSQDDGSGPPYSDTGQVQEGSPETPRTQDEGTKAGGETGEPQAGQQDAGAQESGKSEDQEEEKAYFGDPEVPAQPANVEGRTMTPENPPSEPDDIPQGHREGSKPQPPAPPAHQTGGEAQAGGGEETAAPEGTPTTGQKRPGGGESETPVPGASEGSPSQRDPKSPKEGTSAIPPEAPKDVPPVVEVPPPSPEAMGGKEPAAGGKDPSAEAAKVPGAAERKGSSKPGFLQKVKSLLGKKGEESPSTSGSQGEDESVEAENQETQRKAKELARFAIQNIEKKRISEAKKNINDLITLKPYEADYHLALGLCFRQERRYKDAMKKYQDVLDLGGPKALVNLLKAESAGAENEKEKVYEYLKEAAMGGRNIIHDVQNLPILEKYKSDTEFIKLALYLEKFEVSTKKSQDPFTNPFPPSQASGGPHGPQAAPTGPITLSPQDQQNLLNEARRFFEKVQWYIKLEDEDKAMENYIKLREIIEKKELLTLPKIVNDFRILMSRMENLETQIEGIRLKYYWNQAQARLKDLKEAFQSTEYAKVDSVYVEVEKLTKEMEKSNPRFKPVAERILAAARVWLNRTNIRREFQSSKPEIQGVVISDESKIAIIDNRILKQGEKLGEFYLQKVENNRLTFRYKGEEIPLIFRRY